MGNDKQFKEKNPKLNEALNELDEYVNDTI